MWKEERVNKNVTKGCPVFSLCCMKGAVRLPPIPHAPQYLLDLYHDKKRGPSFHRLIWLYNAMFAFTSTGGNIDHSIKNGRAPYANGQNHHVFGSLIPNDNETPKFCQLYIYDTINEVDNPLRWVSVQDRESVDIEVVRGLITMLDKTNQLVGEFRQQRDLYKSDEIVELLITLKVIRSESGRECHISSTDEVAGIMVGDTEETCGDRDIVVNEKGIVLLVGYVGLKRYMQQNFQDALAVCCYIGHPDIFLTMTCNSLWDEIQKMMEYVPGCIAPNCPDIISKVFRLKLDQLMVDIKDKKHFGVCNGVMYIVEFQKRGLPHVRMLIWLDANSKKNLKQNVDKFVSAEIPDLLLDPVGYAAVKEFMIQGPCGLQNIKSPCMKDLRYIHHFPKEYCARSTFDDSGFPMYMRCWTNITVEIRKTELDNQWVVPYNRDLLVKYLCGAEISYRIFGFPIHHRSISIERLPFHLPGDKNCTFRANEALGKVASREKNKFKIDELLRSVGKSLKKFDQLPQPPRSYLNNGTNNLIIEETSYDNRKMEYEVAKLLQDCTEEQRKIYDAVIQSIDGNIGGILFVYGSGGCGKTFLWRTLICNLRSESKIVLPVATSEIAATLMPGGRTAHSRFKIPTVLDECSTCNIADDSDIMQLIKHTQLIIWDEAPMPHRYAFECLDRSLKDIMKAVDPEHYNMPFGGITVVLGGDFCQILPVITYGDRADIVAACITRSRLWSNFQVFLLIENMRLKQGESDGESEDKFCDVQTENAVDNMICSTSRILIFLTKATVHKEFGGIDEDLNEAFPVEYLNSLNVDGMPPHDLKLKVGAVVMLIRNLNQTLGLCNAIRMIVTKCLKFCVECEVICGIFVGSKHFIPRMKLFPSDTKMPFKLSSNLTTGLAIFVDDESGATTNLTQNVVYKKVFYGLPEA
ncbi:uncharacterized protein LOC141674540 [Apium graveolens]|uniref:uncharacterized protein LOC141674540 n=1 Tax=Apium graveolens TaxID=4045 RepID=UPI003D7BEFF5